MRSHAAPFRSCAPVSAEGVEAAGMGIAGTRGKRKQRAMVLAKRQDDGRTVPLDRRTGLGPRRVAGQVASRFVGVARRPYGNVP